MRGESLGTLALAHPADVHAAGLQFAKLLRACNLPGSRIDFLLTGFSTLCRLLQAAGATHLQLGLERPHVLRLHAVCSEPPVLHRVAPFFALHAGSALQVAADVQLAAWPQSVEALRELVNARTRENLIRELEQHKAGLELEVQQRTLALVQRESQIRDMLEQSPVASRLGVLADRRPIFVNRACLVLFEEARENFGKWISGTNYAKPEDDRGIRQLTSDGHDVPNTPSTLRTKKTSWSR
jgi:hypothetical protein